MKGKNISKPTKR